jgi:hypothetical protein
MPNPPTPRRGEALPADHPLVVGDVEVDDCIALVPSEVLDELVDYHTDRGGVPAGEPVPDDEELI